MRVASTSTNVPSGSPMAAVEVRLDAVDGPILATATSRRPEPDGLAEPVRPGDRPRRSHKLYLVFRSVPGGQTGNNLFNLNWVGFEGQGVSTP